MGRSTFVWLLIAVALSALRRRATIFLGVLATGVTTSLVVAGLKLAVGRERPPAVVLEPAPLLEVPTTSSFPSGHAASSFACALLLARIAPRLAVWLFALAALIAFSRVYAGVHYPLDVLAGALLGLSVAIALLTLRAALRRSPRSPPPG